MKKKKRGGINKLSPIHSTKNLTPTTTSLQQNLDIVPKRYQHISMMLIIAIISMALYANTLQNGFVYDDYDAVVNNIFIKDLSNLPKLLGKEYGTLSGEMTYRLVVTLTYFLDHAIYGLKPWAFFILT